jgi:hypothetical protein
MSSARWSAGWWATSTWARSRACCRACSRPSSTSAWSAPRSCTWPTSWPLATRAGEGETAGAPRRKGGALPIERQVFEGQVLMVQVIKDPIGTKGARLSTQISIAGRLLVFLPQDNHIGVSQKIPTAQRDALRARLQALAGEAGRRLHPAHQRRGRQRRRAGRGHRLPAQDLGAHQGGVVRLPPLSLLHQDLNLLQRVLRDLVGEHHPVIRIDSREQFDALLAFGREFMPGGSRQAAALQGRAADFRPVFHRRGDRPGAGPAGRSQVGRLPDHRPDRGADHRGRQHRRLCRCAQFRRHHLQDQPGGCACHRAPAAPAQPGRHHHCRFHRHGARRPSRGRAGRVPQATRARPRQDHGGRLFAAGPGGNDAQAHARIAGPHAVRALRGLPGAGACEDRAQRGLRHPARDPARGAAVQPARVPRGGLAAR